MRDYADYAGDITSPIFSRRIVEEGPSGPFRDSGALARRRWIMAGLCTATMVVFLAAMVRLLSYGGITPIEWAMLAAYVLTLPFLAVGLWNALIGFVIYNFRKDAAAFVNPHIADVDPEGPITSRTALALAIRNEAPEIVLARLESMHAELLDTVWGAQFDVHVLSDTNDPAIVRAEERAVHAWRRRSAAPHRIHYRRRQDNRGFKAGNIEEFAARCRDQYEFFLPLDADSSMSAGAILRLVRIMQVSPRIGILQGLVVGAPSRTFFTRGFQFGMRHGMRAFTLGSAWWQGDCGPYWGHNALIRLAAFDAHCRMPVIEGVGPLAGHIMSHDQVEAVLMRRAGYEVRVYAHEDESYEENPPSLPDFIKRESRWCIGNMQYFRLLGLPGLLPTSRVQLALAILMYLGAPAWIAFVTLGASLAVMPAQVEGVPVAYAVGLFAVIITVSLLPKLMGLAQVLFSDEQSRKYGGRVRVIAGGLGETVLSLLMAPAVAFALSICCIGLLFGRRVQWDAQQRSRTFLAPSEAWCALWPQTLFGLGLSVFLAAYAPWAMLFGAPVLISLAFAVPFAVLTTLPALGAWSRRVGLFDIPEDGRAGGTDLYPLPERAHAA